MLYLYIVNYTHTLNYLHNWDFYLFFANHVIKSKVLLIYVIGRDKDFIKHNIIDYEFQNKAEYKFADDIYFEEAII